MIREQSRARLAAARAPGQSLGRPRALNPEQVQIAPAMLADPAITAGQIAEQLGVHRAHQPYASVPAVKVLSHESSSICQSEEAVPGNAKGPLDTQPRHCISLANRGTAASTIAPDDG